MMEPERCPGAELAGTMMIDSTARIHPSARLGRNVKVGAYTVIGANAVIGDGTDLRSHVTIGPNTTIGRNNTIHPYASVGGDPQDLSWHGEETYLVMGDRNVVRENVTINRGTSKGDGFTRIGNGNLIMACAHVAHDCLLGDHIVMANNVLLAGHVIIEDRAILNGASAVHQFTTIGHLAYVGGLTRIVQDVPPYMIVEGNPSKVRKVNIVGLQRLGFDDDRIRALKNAYRTIFRSRQPRAEVISQLEQAGNVTPEVLELIEFLRRTDRGRHGRGRNV
ncbi:MAG: acyl-ACP--UDP-N-acetylglucosamine O-acyltransferase [Planctomycetes bacterium]|nr:acyl-ACP--UDP-N-acetylglucosamine O-acyltransferase [Planctomycetota bacterium]